ncbi:hypothetical protein TcCL_ESM10364 [Trypanosoma cruzi]|nr:hypothetical protein TcCL_ESM10364 [Trypanosoma cruzi]
MDRRGTRPQKRRSLLCQACRIYGQQASTCNVCPKKVSPNKKNRQKTARGRPPLMKADDGGHTHPATHHQPPQKTSHRAADASSDRPKLPDAIDEEGGRGDSRNVCAVNAGAENASGGAIHSISPHARTADQ